jgi:hypothetical protein
MKCTGTALTFYRKLLYRRNIGKLITVLLPTDAEGNCFKRSVKINIKTAVLMLILMLRLKQFSCASVGEKKNRDDIKMHGKTVKIGKFVVLLDFKLSPCSECCTRAQAQAVFEPSLFPYKYSNILKPSHSSYLSAYEDGTE